MTVSNTASVSATINSLLSGSSTSTSNTSGTYSQLKTALNEAIAAGSGSALPLYQSLVTLSKSESSSDSSASQTYNAKGLLTSLKLATNLSDPLLQTEDSSQTTGLLGNSSTSGSSLSALYAAIGAAGSDS
ncbi:hypothetical protein [Propionivibrio dicarboxylicus]|uniref:Uncharacterized protein n=1 Tax=Propionivibrio dicarboxylicus TaxID=83767 RepID=A0A1G7UZ05_9RHOO|nr:hypothetical protein [Propionivibrio dicarboxylicus]SDG52521.1 hypothetical protein SAMN05660652_00032 [Propionivibrio dicarboxylicus]